MSEEYGGPHANMYDELSRRGVAPGPSGNAGREPDHPYQSFIDGVDVGDNARKALDLLGF